MPKTTSKAKSKVTKTAKIKTPEVAVVEEHEDDLEHPAAVAVDPEEQDIAELLTKPQKQKKIEKSDIDTWLIDRELENAQNGEDW